MNLKFHIGVEVILAKSCLKYRAYDIKKVIVRGGTKPRRVLGLRDCPITERKKPHIKKLEEEIKKELDSWVPVGGVKKETSPRFD